MLETTDQYLEVAERVNAPSIGLNFDVGHAYCVARTCRRAIAKLAHAHPALSPRGHRGRRGCIITWCPGTGAIDFAEVIEAIRKTGYDGWLTVELYPFVDDPDAAAQARRARCCCRYIRRRGS